MNGVSEEKKEEAIASDKWDFGYLSVPTMIDDMKEVWGDNGTEVLKHVAELFKWESKFVGNFGLIALRTVALIWQELRDELEVLQIEKDCAKWGQKTERRKVLKKYRMSDFVYDNHTDKREALIYVVQAQKKRMEELILSISKECQLKIPERKPDWFQKEPWNFPKDL